MGIVSGKEQPKVQNSQRRLRSSFLLSVDLGGMLRSKDLQCFSKHGRPGRKGYVRVIRRLSRLSFFHMLGYATSIHMYTCEGYRGIILLATQISTVCTSAARLQNVIRLGCLKYQTCAGGRWHADVDRRRNLQLWLRLYADVCCPAVVPSSEPTWSLKLVP